MRVRRVVLVRQTRRVRHRVRHRGLAEAADLAVLAVAVEQVEQAAHRR